MSEKSLQIQGDAAIDIVLAKLDPEDREIVEAALARAEKTEAELRYLADHDSLTGLLDRRRFRAELDQYTSFSARYGGQGAVMIIDIDGLKEVNDRLGHEAGDELLQAVAGCLRQGGEAFRLGGDEFALVLPGRSEPDAHDVVRAVRSRIAPTTAGFGVATYPHSGVPRDELFRAADRALYREKPSRDDSRR